jgi:putative ABC transport system substrate-binding protein
VHRAEMRRRVLLLAAGFPVTAVLARIAWAQSTARRLGWIEPGTETSFAARRRAFFEVLRKAGWTEGHNLRVDYRYAGGRIEQFPALATDLVALKPDCVVATGVDAIKSVRAATSTIPIVMGTIDADPIREGLVASLARPQGNITGMIGIAWELAGKRLELLREIDPRASRIAALFDPRSPAGHAHLESARAAAGTLKLTLHPLELRVPADIEPTFDAVRTLGADALFVIAVGMLNSHRARIADLALRTRLPAIYSNIEFVTDGGLIGYAPDTVAQFRRVAGHVDKILKGARPADLAIMQPTDFELVINLKAARGAGLSIPSALLARADRLIE